MVSYVFAIRDLLSSLLKELLMPYPIKRQVWLESVEYNGLQK